MKLRSHLDTVLYPIPGYKNYYADLLGNIWSTNKRNRHSKKQWGKAPQLLSKFPTGDSRVLSVKLTLSNGKKVFRSVNQLLLLTFVTDKPKWRAKWEEEIHA